MVVVLPRAKHDVLPKTAVIAQVLAVELALGVRLGKKRSPIVTTLNSTVVCDKRRGHVDEVGPAIGEPRADGNERADPHQS